MSPLSLESSPNAPRNLTTAAMVLENARKVERTRRRIWGKPERKTVQKKPLSPQVIHLQTFLRGFLILPYHQYIFTEKLTPRISGKSIIKMVCIGESVPMYEMIGPCRERRFSEPRQIAMYLIRQHFKGRISFPHIGKMFGNRDHTTCMHARNVIAARRLLDSTLDAKLSAYEEKLKETVC